MQHEPVLLEEVVEELHIKNQGRFIDCTLGAGGYTKEIVKRGGIVLGIDADLSMLEIAKQNIQSENVLFVHDNFRNLKKVAEENGFNQVDGIVFDLGVSNVHFSDQERGFSFKNPDALLDMRLDPNSQGVKASDLLNGLREDQLKELLGTKLAKSVVAFRKNKNFRTTGDFNSLFRDKRKSHIDIKTVPYMMLRIAVNSELESLREVLPQAYELLKQGGKLVIVSFHSLEDEIVKNFIKSKGGKKDFIRPSDEEIKRNPKSRSAILRSLIHE